jgi:hypothetical protein
MGDLVDTPLPGSHRVTLANCKQHECRLRGFSVDAEHNSPLAIGLRDVVLYASAKLRAVARFCFTGAQGLNRDPVGLQLANNGLDH